MGKPLGAFFDAYACAAKWDRYAEAGYTVQGTTSVQTPGYLNMVREPMSYMNTTHTADLVHPPADPASTLWGSRRYHTLERTPFVSCEQVSASSDRR